MAFTEAGVSAFGAGDTGVGDDIDIAETVTATTPLGVAVQQPAVCPTTAFSVPTPTPSRWTP